MVLKSNKYLRCLGVKKKPKIIFLQSTNFPKIDIELRELRVYCSITTKGNTENNIK